jgi:hypothetical protein
VLHGGIERERVPPARRRPAAVPAAGGAASGWPARSRASASSAYAAPDAQVSQLPARLGQRLAEVAEQELPPAARRLGVAAHHLDPRPVHPDVRLGDLRRGVDGGLDRRVGGRVVQPALAVDVHRVRLLEQVDGVRQPGVRQVQLVLQLRRLDRALGLGVLADGGRDAGEDVRVGVAGGVEGAQAQVFRPVQQQRQPGSPSRPARPISW